MILLYYHVVPSWTIVFLPLLVLLTLIATLSIGIMISALTVFYRDFRHIVPFLIQIFMFITPVIYSANVFTASCPDGSVAEPDVRNHIGVPLGYPRYEWNFPSLAISTATAVGLFMLCRVLFPPDRASLRRLRMISTCQVCQRPDIRRRLDHQK